MYTLKDELFNRLDELSGNVDFAIPKEVAKNAKSKTAKKDLSSAKSARFFI